MSKQEEWISIIYYKRWAEMLMKMPAELRHKIHDAVDEYIVNRALPTDERILFSTFFSIKEQIDYDKEVYNSKVVRRNRENGRLGGRPKKSPNNPQNPVGLQEPKKADTVTDTVTDTLSLKGESAREGANKVFNPQSIKEQLLSDETWKESVCMQSTLGVSFISMLPAQLDKFIAYIVSIGEERSISNISDAKRRFTYWWQNHGRKEVQNENKQVYTVPN